MVKNLCANAETQETWVRSWDHEDPLEEEIATQSSILAQRIPWAEEPGRLQSIPERGHGNPLQYSCLENPMERSLVGYGP